VHYAFTPEYARHIRPDINYSPTGLRWLVQPWLRDCLESNDFCRKSLSGEIVDDGDGPVLPTRVLQVRISNKPQFIKLVEPQGCGGRYCALSHCWGSDDRRPYRTIRSNLEDHLNEIPLSVLPQTFQDAIAIVRALEIDYVWIDSLCIVQDSEQDWRQESEKMALVYGHAFIVVAAAGAQDSTEGMLNCSRLLEFGVHIPCTLESNRMDITINIAPFDLGGLGGTDPSEGPLYHRAWARQEWHLARRLLSFMPGGCSWLCREREVHGWDEWGKDIDVRDDVPSLSQRSIPSWLCFLNKYSKANLTFQTDRLPAMVGIASAFKTKELGAYSHGLWAKELEVQLLWYRDVPDGRHDLKSLPSWTWAARGGSTICADHIAMSDRYTALASAFFHSDSSQLYIRGALPRVYTSSGTEPVRDCCQETIWLWHSDDCDRNNIDHGARSSSLFLESGNMLDLDPVGIGRVDDEDEAFGCDWQMLPLVSSAFYVDFHR